MTKSRSVIVKASTAHHNISTWVMRINLNFLSKWRSIHGPVLVNNTKENFFGKHPKSIVNVDGSNKSRFDLKKFEHNILR